MGKSKQTKVIVDPESPLGSTLPPFLFTKVNFSSPIVTEQNVMVPSHLTVPTSRQTRPTTSSGEESPSKTIFQNGKCKESGVARVESLSGVTVVPIRDMVTGKELFGRNGRVTRFRRPHRCNSVVPNRQFPHLRVLTRD